MHRNMGAVMDASHMLFRPHRSHQHVGTVAMLFDAVRVGNPASELANYHCQNMVRATHRTNGLRRGCYGLTGLLFFLRISRCGWKPGVAGGLLCNLQAEPENRKVR